MSMSYRGILFDLDGTLLNTLDDIADSVNLVLASSGFMQHPVDSFRFFVGGGASQLMEQALPPEHRDPFQVEKAVKEFEERYAENWHKKTALYAEIPELLEELHLQGYALAILSNKPSGFTQLCFQRYLQKWPFHPVWGQRDGIPLKPDPQGALEVARTLKIPPQDFLYLGDSATDIWTAQGAGMTPVGVLWGFRLRQELQDAGALHLLQNPLELLSLLQKMTQK
jgi:phosphoglycolate phosphatase